MNDLVERVTRAQTLLRERLQEVRAQGGLTRERYVRFLSMQYHLTQGVQRHFMAIAASPLTARKKALRAWLIGFAQEEEFHYQIAEADLRELGAQPLAIPFDTELWWCYFDAAIATRPYIRLGATAILENISDGSADVLDDMIRTSDFLTPKSLRFLTIHRHGPNLAHGDQVLQALQEARLNDGEWSDVLLGAERATTLYMRFVHWIAHGDELR